LNHLRIRLLVEHLRELPWPLEEAQGQVKSSSVARSELMVEESRRKPEWWMGRPENQFGRMATQWQNMREWMEQEPGRVLKRRCLQYVSRC
jgi:hypothetical protein